MAEINDGLKKMVYGIYELENPEKAKRLNDKIASDIINQYNGDYKQIINGIYELENHEKAKRINDTVYSNFSNQYGLGSPQPITQPQTQELVQAPGQGEDLTPMQKQLREKGLIEDQQPEASTQPIQYNGQRFATPEMYKQSQEKINPQTKFSNEDIEGAKQMLPQIDKLINDVKTPEPKPLDSYQKNYGMYGGGVDLGNKEQNVASTTKATLEKAKDYYEAVANGDSNAAKKFWNGLKTIDLENALTFGIKGMANSIDIYNAAKNYSEGKATQEEQNLLMAKAMLDEIQSVAQKDRATSVGSGLGEMAPWLAQFAVTGGIGSTVSKAALGSFESMMAKNLLGKVTGKILAGVASSGVQTAAQMPTMVQGTAERMTGRFENQDGNLVQTEQAQPLGEALGRTYANNFLETFSERVVGDGFDGAFKALGSGIVDSKVLGNTFVADAINFGRNNRVFKMTNKTLGLNSPITENIEEAFTGLTQPLVTERSLSDAEKQIQQYFTAENLFRTFLTTAAMGTGAGLLQLPNGIIDERKYRNGKKIVDNLSPEDKATWDVITTAQTIDERKDAFMNLWQKEVQKGTKASDLKSLLYYYQDYTDKIKLPETQQSEQPQENTTQQPVSPDAQQQFTVSPRQTKEAELRQMADQIKTKDTGTIKIVEIANPEGTDNTHAYVVATNVGLDGKSVYRTIDDNGVQGWATEKSISGEPQEIDVESFVAQNLGVYDQQEQANALSQQNQMMYKGQLIERIGENIWQDENYNRIQLPEEEYQAWVQAKEIDPNSNPDIVTQQYGKSKITGTKNDDGSILISQPATAQQAEALKAEVEESTGGNATVQAQLVENQDATAPQQFQLSIIPVQAQSNESVQIQPENLQSDTSTPSQDNGLKAEPTERKITPQTFGKTQIDIIEGEEFDEVVPNEKVTLEKALPILEKEFKDNEDYQVVSERVQVEIPAENKYKKPTYETVIKSIKIVPKEVIARQKQADTNALLDIVDDFNSTPQNREDKQKASEIQAIAKQLGYQTERNASNQIRLFDNSGIISRPQVEQTVNNSEQQPEKVAEVQAQNTDDLVNSLFSNENSLQNNQQNEKPVENITEDAGQINQLQGEDTPQTEQGQRVQEGLEENVNIPTYGKTVETKIGLIDLVVEPNLQSDNPNSLKITAYNSDGRTIGFSSSVINPTNKTLTIKVSQVKEPYQRKGVYSKIVDEFQAIANERGLTLEREKDAETNDSKEFWNSRSVSTDQPVGESLTADPVAEQLPDVRKTIKQTKKPNSITGKAKEVEVSESDIQGLALQYFINGGMVKSDEILRMFKDSSKERSDRFSYTSNENGQTVNQIAHNIWEALPENIQNGLAEMDVYNAVENAIKENSSAIAMAKKQLKRYSLDPNQGFTEEWLNEQIRIEEEERRSELELWMNDLTKLEINGQLPTENELIELFLPENTDNGKQEINQRGSLESDRPVNPERNDPFGQNVQGSEPGVQGEAESEKPKVETREQLEARLSEERKQRILSEGTGFDKEFGLIPPSEIKSSDDILSNIDKILTTLKSNEGNGKYNTFEGFASGKNYTKNAGEQVRGYFLALDVLPNEIRKDFALKINATTHEELSNWAAKQYKELKPESDTFRHSESTDNKDIKNINPTLSDIKSDTEAEVKEPWQMTRSEWRNSVNFTKSENRNEPNRIDVLDKKTGEYLLHGNFNQNFIDEYGEDKVEKSLHKRYIEKSLSEGKPVPQEVLNDYPELQKSKPLTQLFEEGVKEPEIPISEDGLYQIYPAKVKNKDGGIDNYFVVPSVENKESRGFGDDMFKTLPEAIEQVRLNRIEEVEIQKEKAEKEKQKEIDAQIAADKQAKKEANKGKPLIELMNEAKNEKILDTKVNFNGVIKTRREHTEDVINNGGYTETKEVNRIKEPTKLAWNRMNEKQQSESDRRIKEGGTKTEYRLFSKEGTFNEVTKAEYDYANSLIEEGVKAREEKKQRESNLETKKKDIEARRKKDLSANDITIKEQEKEEGVVDRFIELRDKYENKNDLLEQLVFNVPNGELKFSELDPFTQQLLWEGKYNDAKERVGTLKRHINAKYDNELAALEQQPKVKKQSTPLPEEKQNEPKKPLNDFLAEAKEIVKNNPKEVIEDFGEKIEGARKDQIKKYFDKINLNGKILSTIFPKPDIKSLLESGLSVKDVAGIKVAHEFATQDKKKGERVIKFYAAYAKNILAESINLEYKNEGYVFTEYGKSQIELRTKAYQDVHDKLGADYLALDLTKVSITEPDKSGRTTYFSNGEPIAASDVNYIVRYYVNTQKYFPTLPEAIDYFTEQVKANTKIDQVVYKRKLNIYYDKRVKGEFYIGYPSKGDVIKLKDGFKASIEAFESLKNPEILSDLQTMLERILAENRQAIKPSVRLKYSNETARERVGKDWRNGKDIGSKELAETFGFRAIEFGNWVNQKERQVFVNNTYDSLMDLAQLLNISPKAISLAGNLGLTFGSRGSGKAAAHYEPGRKIINLTKTQGLGSLAHEWWHGVDNYFADFKTALNGMKSASAQEYSPESRDEIKKSFDELYKAVNNYSYKQRAKNLDGTRNVEYFALPYEMSARAFENFMLNKLAQSGQVNDFIVNFISNEDWNGEANKYPYPKAEESVDINEAFQQLFDTIQEKEENGNRAMFRIIGETGAGNLDKAEEATTRLDNLAIAREMETSGKDAKTISLATGWEKGVDGKWRYEVPDVNITDKGLRKLWDLIPKDEALTLPDILENDKSLYEEYPSLFDVKVYFDKSNGLAHWDSFNQAIALNNNYFKQNPSFHNMDIKSILIHEIQHAIQDIEGFAKGGSPRQFEIDNVTKIVIDVFEQEGSKQKAKDRIERLMKANNPEYMDSILFVLDSVSEDQLNQIIKDNKLSKEERYKRLAGEVESRNVQSRMNMTPEERRNTLLQETEDVSREDQIILMDGMGVSNLEEGNSIQSTIDFLQSNDPLDKQVHFKSKKDIVSYLEANRHKFAQNTIDSVKKTDFHAIQIDDEVFINSDISKSNDDVIIDWVHERFHVQLLENIPDEEQRNEVLNDLYESLGQDEVRRIVPRGYWKDPSHSQANEYLTHAAQQLVTNGKLDENIHPEIRDIITNIVNQFTTLKNIQDAKDNRIDLSNKKESNRNENASSGNRREVRTNTGTNGRKGNNTNASLRSLEGAGKVDKSVPLLDFLSKAKETVKGNKSEVSLGEKPNDMDIYEYVSILEKNTGLKFKRAETGNSHYYNSDKLKIRVSDHPSKFTEKQRGTADKILDIDYKYDINAISDLLNGTLFSEYKKGDKITHTYDKIGDLEFIEYLPEEEAVKVLNKDGEEKLYYQEKFFNDNYKSQLLKENTTVNKKELPFASRSENESSIQFESKSQIANAENKSKENISGNNVKVKYPEENYDLTEDEAWKFEYDLTESLGLRGTKDYHVINGNTILRIKGHTPNWSNFSDDLEDNQNIKRVINVTVGDYNNSDFRRNKTSLDEIEKEYPNVEFTDIQIEDGESIFDNIDFISKIINKSKKQEPNTILIDGVSRPTLNSKGLPIAQTEEGIRNFYRWFGDSKVVDEQGRPLVVFHGSFGNFDEFAPEYLGSNTEAGSAKEGFFFASNPKVATSYASSFALKAKALMKRANEARSEIESITGHSYMTASFNVFRQSRGENNYSPEVIEKLHKLIKRVQDAEDVENQDEYFMPEIKLARSGKLIESFIGLQNPIIKDYQGESFRDEQYVDVINKAKTAGHDGVIFRNTFDGMDAKSHLEQTDVIVAFNPSQIKSATGNNGSFDPDNNNINYKKTVPLNEFLANASTNNKKKFVKDGAKMPDSVNSDVDKNMKSAHGLRGESILDKLKRWGGKVREQARHFEHIREADYPAVYNKLRILESIPDIVKKEAYDKISTIIRPIVKTKNYYEAFERFVVLNDLMSDINKGLYDGKDLPWGYNTQEEVRQDAINMKKYVNENPDVKKVIEERNAMMRSIRDQLIKAKLLDPKAKDSEAYFHHQVLMFMESKPKNFPGLSISDARVKNIGAQKGRVGSAKAYNTNYIEAEFEVIAQTLEQLETRKILDRISDDVNIFPDIFEQAQNEGENWKSIVPEGYVKWYPKKGTNAYKAASFAEKALTNALESPENVETVLEMTAEANNSMWVIPADLAKQLDSMKVFEKENPISQVFKGLTTGWKQYILFNPYRAAKYMVNNLSGDIDIVLAYDPRVLKYVPDAVRELKANAQGNEMSADMQAALHNRVIGSGVTVNEIQDINKEGVLKMIQGSDYNLIRKYFSAAMGANNFRENTLRLAAYKYFKDKVDSGKNVYGASKKKSIDAIVDKEEKAGRLAVDLLGDYGNISQAGVWMREHVFPFWSWVEVNSPRYYHLLRNTRFEDGKTLAAVGARKTGINVVKYGLKASILMALVVLWNRAFFPDEDDEISQTMNDGKLYLILGRTDEGDIRMLKVTGSLSDMLSYAGLDNVVNDVNNISKGKSNIGREAKEAGKAIVNKFVQGAMPLEKTAVEPLFGKTIYPDVFQPREIRDAGEHIARVVSMDKVYRLLTKKPMKSLSKEMQSLLLYNSNPGEAAYYAVREKVYDFLDEKGIERLSGAPTKKSNTLYYFKQALKYGDEELAKDWLQKYYDLGGTEEGMRRSIDKGEVLSPIPEKYQDEFMQTLDKDDLELIEISRKWYDNTYK